MTIPAQTRSVAERLADTPTVRDTVLSAAAAARGVAGAQSHAMTHSWVLTGPPGSGRSLVALNFAAALVCEMPDGEIGCGRCESCRDALEGSHTDIVHVVPTELSIAKSVVDKLVDDAHRLPTVADYRVLIVEDADRFTGEAADAFLKTVEEPPASTVILMCAPSTDPEDFSQTLRSRCRHLYVPEPSTEEIVRILTQQEGASEADARLAAVTSLHHVGRARRLIRSTDAQKRRALAIQVAELIYQGDQAFQAVSSLVKAVKKEAETSHTEEEQAEREKLERALGMGGRGKGVAKATRGASGSIKELEEKQKKRRTRYQRDIFDLVLVDLAGVYRDALMVKTGASVGLTHPDFEGQAREIATRASVEGLVQCLDAISLCRARFGQNVQPQIALDGMIGAIRIALNAH